MASKLIYIQIIVCVISIAYSNDDLLTIPILNENKIKITTGTGAFCGHTVTFITNHLVPTYDLYKNFLEIEFIPWGRATLEADGTVTCLHGNNDCWANRVHRCVIDSLKDNQDAQMNYMACEFSKRSAFLLGSYECVHEIGLNLIEIDYCVNNPTMDDLDVKARDAVDEAMATINGVPSIVFNDEVNVTLHNAARQRLRSLVCFSLVEVPEAEITGCPIF